ncbi:hypothetical protein HHI36_015229 [Cryptolaemus montrouzieri]|uniref:glucose-6-phosphate 1-epimerase n=1 Tax=Cryptolaemus montrouzieri TaxID=559131 RepID=A0ABD2N4Y4_9CUCU
MDLTTLNQIYLDRGDNVQCTISRFGANITSWTVWGVEQLFVSRKTTYNNLKPIKGGIMLIFPHYKYWSLGPSNGFASMMVWKIDKGPFKLPTGDIQVILVLEQGQIANNIWNYQYHIQYTVTLLEKELHLDWTIKNLSKYSFHFNFLFSNHVRVPDIRNCKLQGVKDSKYIDEINDLYLLEQKDDEILLDCELNKIFVSTTENIIITDIMAERNLYVHKVNLPDTIVQTIGEEKGKSMEDFCPNEWNKMLILEFGHKYQQINLLPNCSLESHLKLKVKSDKEVDNYVIRFY